MMLVPKKMLVLVWQTTWHKIAEDHGLGKIEI
jgi:hypothetical protein